MISHCTWPWITHWAPFACSIKWVTEWFHWSQQSLIICITCNILSSHKASHLTHLYEIWRKLHKNDSQLQDESSDYLLGATHKVWDHEQQSLLTHYFYPTATMVGLLQPKRRMKLKGKISYSVHMIQTPKLGTQILLDYAALRSSCQVCCKLRCPKRFHKSAVPLRAQSWVHLTSIGLAPSTTNITENSTVHTGHNRLIVTYLGRTELVLSWTFGMLHVTLLLKQ